ncbi:MAG: hypothetical protein QOH66_2948 [Actinomycetota bacterium]|nr:hypothetical protein [Actinomycetota bacterium]
MERLVTSGCGVCGKPLSASQQQWCSNAHRQAAYRRRRHQPAAAALPPAHSRRQGTVYECPDCDTRLVGEQYCPDCHTFARRVGPGGVCPCCGEIVTLAELIAGM